MKSNNYRIIIKCLRELLFLSLFFTSYPIMAQFGSKIIEIGNVEYIATYSMEYQEDSSRSNWIRQTDMLLLFGQNSSKFISSNFYIADSLTRISKSADEFIKLVTSTTSPVPLVYFQTEIIKDYRNKKLTVLDYVIGEGSFKYHERMDVCSWNVTNDTSSIMGYRTQKATCKFGGREWIAWFTTQIPYSDGPYKFTGLPGLILMIHDTRRHYVFEILSLKKPSYPLKVDYKDIPYFETTKQEFFKSKDAFREDVVSRAKAAKFSTDVQQSLYKKMAARNNPIELKRR